MCGVKRSLRLPTKASVIRVSKKMRVTAGEVDKLGKELGNCSHQRKTNDDTNTLALSTLSPLQVKPGIQKLYSQCV